MFWLLSLIDVGLSSICLPSNNMLVFRSLSYEKHLLNHAICEQTRSSPFY